MLLRQTHRYVVPLLDVPEVAAMNICERAAAPLVEMGERNWEVGVGSTGVGSGEVRSTEVGRWRVLMGSWGVF